MVVMIMDARLLNIISPQVFCSFCAIKCVPLILETSGDEALRNILRKRSKLEIGCMTLEQL